MRDWNLKLGRWFGIEVQIHWLFLLMIFFEIFWWARYGTWGLMHWAIFTVFLFVIVLLHEFGHCFAGRMVGGSADRILMWPLGGLAFVHAPYQPTPQLIVAGGGPLVNVGFLVLLAPYIAFGSPVLSSHWLRLGDPWASELNTFERYVSLFYGLNLDLLLFNLIPAYPMDGGRILRSLLWYRLDLRQATIVTAHAARVCAFLMAVGGVFLLTQGANGLFLMLIAIFVWIGAEREKRLVEGGYLYAEGQESYYTPSYQEPSGIGAWWRRRRERREQEQQEKEAKRESEMKERVDALLERVHREGMDSLSSREQKFLRDASRHFRR